MNLKNQGLQGLTIYAWRHIDGRGGAVGRLGLPFDYNPPPAVVSNFRLSFGDKRIEARFTGPNENDLQSYLVHFAYSAEALNELSETPVSIDTGETTLTSPMAVSAADFSGRVSISPFSNGRAVFVRVQVKDTSGKLSSDNPPALSIIPSRTLSVSEALGGSNSCSLEPRSPFEWLQVFLLLGFAIAAARLRANRRKQT